VTSVVALYDALPSPDAAALEAIEVLTGRARGLVEVSSKKEKGK